VTPALLVAIAAGAAIGTGAWLVITPPGRATARASLVRRARAGLAGPAGLRILLGVGAGVLVLVLSRWVAVAAAVSVVVIAWPVLFGAAAQQRATIAKLEGVATWIEALRDIIAASSALPEAIAAASLRPSPALADPMGRVVAHLSAQEPIEQVLRRLADDIDDPIADQAIAALVLNVRVQGRQLQTALSGLAVSTRAEVETRRTVEAERRKSRRAVAIVMVMTVAMTVGMAVFSREYARPYSTLPGQIVLGVVVALFAAGFTVIRQMSRYTTADRFLTQRAGR